jgi:hypothetical protein
MARAQSEIRQIVYAIAYAQGVKGRPLYTFSVSDCGQCNCTVITSAACYSGWITALTGIQNSTDGIYPDLVSKFARDPWGNPYQIDANQGVNYNLITNPTCNSVDGLWAHGKAQSNFVRIPLSPICP